MKFPLPTTTSARRITTGPDGNLLFTEGFKSKIGCIPSLHDYEEVIKTADRPMILTSAYIIKPT
jgi:hypothetical protein